MLYTLLKTTLSYVIEITPTNTPNNALSKFEFVVINFYDSSIASMNINSIFLKAEEIYSTKNSNSVAWAQLNAEKYPDLFPFERDQ